MTDKFEDPCALNPPSKSVQAFSSWSEAFSVAKSVEPQDLGTFKPPSESSDKWGAGNVGMLSEIARQYHGTKRKVNDDQDQHECDEKQKVKKRKKEKKDKKDKKKRFNEEDEKNERASAQESPDETLDPLEDNQRPLEGQIVMHNGEQIMVLVDNKKKIVYSMDRTPDGDLIPIGTVQGKQIVLNGTSLKKLIPSLYWKKAIRMYRSRCSYLFMMCIGQISMQEYPLCVECLKWISRPWIKDGCGICIILPTVMSSIVLCIFQSHVLIYLSHTYLTIRFDIYLVKTNP
jgi:hypothetical protein